MSDRDIKNIKQWAIENNINVVFWAYFDENFRMKMKQLDEVYSELTLDNVQLFYNILFYNNPESLNASLS